jgi:hypothetical protein
MLEQRGLLLGPWQPAPPAAIRPVTDLATGAPLGFARRRTGRGWHWLRWLWQRPVEVFETDDASLLCALHRGWSLAWCWEVSDAEGRRVAVVYRRFLLDNLGAPVARAVAADAQHPGRFLARDGRELGTFRGVAGGTALTFADALDNDPFARMALLGAVLAYEG